MQVWVWDRKILGLRWLGEIDCVLYNVTVSERIIPFPFQKKELQDGEKLPIIDRVM